MAVRRLLVVCVAVGLLLPSACLRSKKDSSVLAELQKQKVPAPQPPLPTSGGGSSASALPSGDGVQPPKFDPKTSTIPALPGMPGTASQPLPPSNVPDVPPGGSATFLPSSNKGTDSITFGGPSAYSTPVPNLTGQPIPPRYITVPPLNTATDADLEARLASAQTDDERKGILERIRERRQEKQKEKEKEKEPVKPVEPKLPDALPKDDQPKPKLELKAEPKADPKADPKPVSTDLQVVRDLLSAAAKKNESMKSFEAHLVKREVVKGKELPAEEAVYRFRGDPLSVHIRVIGDVGTGREVMWVKGQNDNKMTLVTGKGDNILLGAGKKMTMDADDPLVTAKSRYRIYEAGMQRPIGALTKFVEQAETGKRKAETIKYVGPVERKEYKTKPTLVEVTLTADDDKFLPKGGKRQYHFDADPKSPAYGLPVLVISLDHENREVEYYCFTDFKLVGELTDADFDHTKVGKKK